MKILNFILTILLIIAFGFIYQKHQELENIVKNTEKSVIAEESTHSAADTIDGDAIVPEEIHEQNFLEGEDAETEETPEISIDDEKENFKAQSTQAWGKITKIDENSLTVEMVITDIDAFFQNYNINEATDTDTYTVTIDDSTVFTGTKQSALTQGDFIKIHADTSLYESNDIHATKILSFEAGTVETVSALEAEEALAY